MVAGLPDAFEVAPARDILSVPVSYELNHAVTELQREFLRHTRGAITATILLSAKAAAPAETMQQILDRARARLKG